MMPSFDPARLAGLPADLRALFEAHRAMLEAERIRADHERAARRPVARYAGLTGSPDESGSRRRERGLSRAGNPRVPRGMVQLAWRFLVFQKDCDLVRWFRTRTPDARARTKMAVIVAFARELLITLWRMARGGEVPQGLKMRKA